jgi:Uri superfamily endonuclease
VKGVYVLLIQLSKDISIIVGAKGKIRFAKGLYAYVGSAQNGLETRIKRHLGKKKRKFWHIDYLLNNATSKVVKTFYKQAARTDECTTAKEISQQGEAVIGFGCSDCKCRSHLFRLESCESLQEILKEFNVETH